MILNVVRYSNSYTSPELSWEPVTCSLRDQYSILFVRCLFSRFKRPPAAPPPPPPPAHKKKWCRINSDTPQFLIKTSWAIKYSYFSIAVRTANLRTQDLTPFLDFLSTNGLSTASCCIIDHFTVMSLVPYPPSERDAEVDLVLIQTSFLFL